MLWTWLLTAFTLACSACAIRGWIGLGEQSRDHFQAACRAAPLASAINSSTDHWS
jgi:hypothetical protein